jgi:DNA-binding protein
MNIKDKIKNLREMNGWSQEVMAERLNMSKNGYARIERGESKLDMERLEKIAEIFSLEVVDLISQEYECAIFVIGGDSSNSSNNTGNNTTYYGNDHSLASENEKLKLIIQHKDELLAQKDNEIVALKKLVAALEANQQNP